MSSEWLDTTWGQLTTLEYGKAIRDYQNAKGAVPVYGTNGPIGWHDKPLYPSAGVVVGRKGAYRGIHYSSKPFFVIDTAFYLKPKVLLDTKWAYYCLLTYDINGMDSGSAIPSTSREEFYKLPVRIPCLAEQQQIAKILSLFDDRISLLRETNATLESIAQALFKSWFVDFDPVHAKQQGRAPEGMDEATAGLFPDSFERVGQELVPKGWQVLKLEELVASSGGTIQTGPFGSQLHASDYVEDGIPVVMPKDILGRRVVTGSIARVRATDADRLARHKMRPGDIVFSRRGDVERHALIGKREMGWLCGTGCLLVRPGAAFPSSTFLSMMLDAPRSRKWLVQHAVGATMPNLNTGILGSVPVVVPSGVVLKAFENVIAITEEQLSHNASLAETLANLREALLPRLISGRLRLTEAEAIAAKAA